jgi:biopolymer transport protein ExbB/TolQ
MEKYKILKVFFIVFLVLIYGVYAFFDEFVIFFTSTLMFNLAITLMFTVGLIVLFSGLIKMIMLEIHLETIDHNLDNLKTKHLSLSPFLYPKNISNIFTKKLNQDTITFTEEEKLEVVEHLEEYFNEKQVYIDFFVGTSLMLGLLGTFMGLLISIDKMSGIIDLIAAMEVMDIKVVIKSFGGPLAGMATGFGSSLFGVIVAILLNLLYYIFSKSKTRFINKLTIFFNSNLQEEHIVNQMTQQININHNQEELLKGIHSLLQTSVTQNKELIENKVK